MEKKSSGGCLSNFIIWIIVVGVIVSNIDNIKQWLSENTNKAANTAVEMAGDLKEIQDGAKDIYYGVKDISEDLGLETMADYSNMSDEEQVCSVTKAYLNDVFYGKNDSAKNYELAGGNVDSLPKSIYEALYGYTDRLVKSSIWNDVLDYMQQIEYEIVSVEFTSEEEAVVLIEAQYYDAQILFMSALNAALDGRSKLNEEELGLAKMGVEKCIRQVDIILTKTEEGWKISNILTTPVYLDMILANIHYALFDEWGEFSSAMAVSQSMPVGTWEMDVQGVALFDKLCIEVEKEEISQQLTAFGTSTNDTSVNTYVRVHFYKDGTEVYVNDTGENYLLAEYDFDTASVVAYLSTDEYGTQALMFRRNGSELYGKMMGSVSFDNPNPYMSSGGRPYYEVNIGNLITVPEQKMTMED